MLATAFCLFLSRILAYICVVAISLCPSSLLTVYMSVPMSSIMTAKVWRAQWKVIFLWIPARSTQRLIHSPIVLELCGRSWNTGSLSPLRSPISSTAWLVISRYSCPLVFFCLKTIRVKAPLVCTSPQINFRTSLSLSPVKQEKRNARRTPIASQGVCDNMRNSSNVRHSLSTSSFGKFFIPKHGSEDMMPRLKASCIAVLSLVKYVNLEFGDNRVFKMQIYNYCYN